MNDFDFVFVGTGDYVSKPNADMLNFLKGLDLNSSRKFALFMTLVRQRKKR